MLLLNKSLQNIQQLPLLFYVNDTKHHCHVLQMITKMEIVASKKGRLFTHPPANLALLSSTQVFPFFTVSSLLVHVSWYVA